MSDHRVFLKCAWRLIPLMMVLYVMNYLDRTNVAFAALTMNKGYRLFTLSLQFPASENPYIRSNQETSQNAE